MGGLVGKLTWNYPDHLESESISPGRCVILYLSRCEAAKADRHQLNYHNWSWLFDSNRPPVPPVIPRVHASGKSQPSSESGELTLEKNQPVVNLRELRVPEWMVPTKK